jgi:hypothetical protein
VESLSESKQPPVQVQKQPPLESHRHNPVQHDGFTAKGYHIYNLKVDINVTDFETLYTLSTQYKTSPIFNQEIQTDTSIDKINYSIMIIKEVPAIQSKIERILLL